MKKNGSSFQLIVLKAGRIMGLIFSIILVCLFVFGGVLLLWSPGKPNPFLGEDGAPLVNSLSEKVFVNINGIEQGMFIKSKNLNNPILLFVHGGPGMPECWLTRQYPTGLENYFTVVWWEQRGAGLSFSPDIPPETMNEEQFISDTIEVTKYLCKRFDNEKIYLMAHSWGSYIAIQAAARAPDLYHAYIGVAQISYQIDSEQMAYEYAHDYYKKVGDVSMLKKLESAPPTSTVPLPVNYISIRDEYMHRAGIGTTHDMQSVVTGIFLPSLQFPEYTLKEKIKLWRGKISSRSPKYNLWNKMLMTDMSSQIPELKIPIYFLHGVYDYTCAYPLTKEYFKKLKAPLKGFYTFEQSAHTPVFEEPEKTLNIMIENVLIGTNSLADVK